MLCNLFLVSAQYRHSQPEMILIVSSQCRLNFPGCQAVILAQELLSRDYIAKTIIWINWLLAASSCFLIITVVRGGEKFFCLSSDLGSIPL